MKKRIMLLGVYLLLSHVVFSQQEVIIESSEEVMDTIGFSNLLNTVNTVTRVHEEELSLFKVDLYRPVDYAVSKIFFKSISENDSVDLTINLITLVYERKINPQLSWIASAALESNFNHFTSVELSGGCRYYYNMNRRILKGKSANNFSANYVSTFIKTQTKPADKEQHVSMNLVYGLQRRLGKMFFFDFYLGIETKDTRVGINTTAQFLIGLAL